LTNRLFEQILGAAGDRVVPDLIERGIVRQAAARPP